MKWRMLQADLAKRLGISVVSISNWERGVTEPTQRIRKRCPADGQKGPQFDPGVVPFDPTGDNNATMIAATT